MTPDRKRGRSLQEDEGEFMPLSKRINNLHINNGQRMNNSNSMGPAEWGPNHFVQLPETPPNCVQSLNWNMPQYAPGLSESENPHYFNVNRLLFDMYVQRLQRGCLHQV